MTSSLKIGINNADNVMPESLLRFKPDLAARLAAHDMVWGEPHGPPASWRAGAPIGNGDFGALIYGYPDNLCFALGKTDLWDRGGMQRSTFPDGTFAEFRKTFDGSDEQGFQRLCETVRERHGERQHATTAGMFRLHLHDADLVTQPALRVSLWDGVASLTFMTARTTSDYVQEQYKPTAVEALASRAFQALAIRIKPDNCPPGSITWELARAPHAPHPPAEVKSANGIHWLRQEFAEGGGYVVAISAAGGDCLAFPCNDRLAGEFHPCGVDETTIYLTIVSTNDAADPMAEALARLARARDAGYEAIRREHAAWWERYWRRGYVCVGDAAVEKWWYTSLYLCASTIEPGRQSPGLQGVWIKENVPAWLGDYHTNVNLQCVYWGLMSANRLDLMEPYVRLLCGWMDQCRRDTRDYFQMRGIRFPHAGTIDGYETTSAPYANLGVSIGGSGWLTQLVWQIFEYTGDMSFLRETAYPLLKEVALFYEDYLVWDEKAERWALAPSVHFEVLFPGLKSWGRNSLYDLTMVHGAFRRAIDAARALGIDEADQARWEAILGKLPDFPTDAESGSWIGFEGREVRQFGSHQFSLPPVFPGELVSLWHGPEAWRRAALATLAHPLTAKSVTGKAWCSQGLREIIRLGRKQESFEGARWPKDAPVNGLVHNWTGPYLQADHGPAMNSALSDMLLLGVGGVMRLFPCFPEDVPAAFHCLRAPGAFLVSAEKRGQEVDYAVIQSLAGGRLRIANPWPGRARLREQQPGGKTVTLSGERVLAADTFPGQILVLDRLERPYETIPMLDPLLNES